MSGMLAFSVGDDGLKDALRALVSYRSVGVDDQTFAAMSR